MCLLGIKLWPLSFQGKCWGDRNRRTTGARWPDSLPYLTSFKAMTHTVLKIKVSSVWGMIAKLTFGLYTHAHIPMYKLNCTHRYTHTHIQTHMHTYILHICLHTCHTYAYIFIYIHTHHIDADTQNWSFVLQRRTLRSWNTSWILNPHLPLVSP